MYVHMHVCLFNSRRIRKLLKIHIGNNWYKAETQARFLNKVSKFSVVTAETGAFVFTEFDLESIIASAKVKMF